MVITSFENYQQFVQQKLEQELTKLNKSLTKLTLRDIKEENALLLAHPNIKDKIKEIKPLLISSDTIETTKTSHAILNGDIFWEHTAAGEATRLGLGTKYILNKKNLEKYFETNENLTKDISNKQALALNTMTMSERNQAIILLKSISNINMGTRHLAQQACDLISLAKTNNFDPKIALANQYNLIIVNENNEAQIIKELIANNFLGFDPTKLFFMVQRAAHGYNLKEGKVYLDTTSKKRLYNHGVMRLQTALNNELFFIQGEEKIFITAKEYKDILATKKLLISINIEDLDWLENSLDLDNYTLGLNLAAAGYEMIMTAIGQKQPPQKGGYFCELDGKTVCIETDADPEMFGDNPDILKRIKYSQSKPNSK